MTASNSTRSNNSTARSVLNQLSAFSRAYTISDCIPEEYGSGSDRYYIYNFSNTTNCPPPAGLANPDFAQFLGYAMVWDGRSALKPFDMVGPDGESRIGGEGLELALDAYLDFINSGNAVTIDSRANSNYYQKQVISDRGSEVDYLFEGVTSDLKEYNGLWLRAAERGNTYWLVRLKMLIPEKKLFLELRRDGLQVNRAVFENLEYAEQDVIDSETDEVKKETQLVFTENTTVTVLDSLTNFRTAKSYGGWFKEFSAIVNWRDSNTNVQQNLCFNFGGSQSNQSVTAELCSAYTLTFGSTNYNDYEFVHIDPLTVNDTTTNQILGYYLDKRIEWQAVDETSTATAHTYGKN